MNYWLDRGGFQLVLYTMLYITSDGNVPDWYSLYAGAVALVIVGIIIQLYKGQTNE